ncbi:MAG: serine hydrolase [Microbacterium sp.]|uniref:serine hydrolase n=1 Tax=Microbacterium sp. TaxID=51671 RepID=UPI001ACCC4BE|nr:serine hydrolase [Microbacterium sp.]MBN9174696.1 serine hydrolase [Microbacterium sp.]
MKTRRGAMGIAVVIVVGALAFTAGADAALAADPVSTPAPSESPGASPSGDTGGQSPSATPVPSLDASPSPVPSPSTPAPSPQPTARSTPHAVGGAAPTAAVAPPTAARLAGADRYVTSVAASRAVFPSGSDVVLIASGLSSIDGVTAAGMASRVGAPLLYVAPDSIPDAVAAELRRLTPDRIIVVGGSGVVSDPVLAGLRSFSPDVERYGGGDRYATSRAVLSLYGTVGSVYVAAGLSLIDAPLASVAAARTGRGVLLVDGAAASADTATVSALRAAGAGTVIIAGGLGTVSAAYEQSLRSAGLTVERRVAADRYAQSVLLAADSSVPASRAILANPDTMADVAVATALAAVTGQPLYYALRQCVPDTVAAGIRSASLAITAVGGEQWLEPAALGNSTCSSVRAARIASLTSSITSTLASYGGSFSVTVRELGGLGEIAQVSGGVRREPASMMKIFAAWAAYKMVESGKASLGTRLPSGVTLGVCIQIMIHVSDNYCHSDIVHWITIPTINAMIRSAGFTNTAYGNVPTGTSVLYAGNRTSTNDLAWMMERLANRTILGKTYSDLLINHMRSQIWRSRIASGIPPGIPQASKPGSLWISTGLLQGDTAIVNGTKSAYILSIVGDTNPPQAALRAVSRAVYTHFNGAFGAAATYPVQQMVTQTASVLHSSPGGPAVLTIPPGVYIQVLDAQRVWYEIQYGSRKLWVYYTGLRNR